LDFSPGMVMMGGSIDIVIAYPKNIQAPMINFEKPASWQKTIWLAGASEMVEWTRKGFQLKTPVFLELENFHLISPGNPTNTTPIGKLLGEIPPQSSFREKAVIKVPSDIPPGPYYITAYDQSLGKIGESSIIEVAKPEKDMSPSPETTFRITKVTYPDTGGTLSVHVEVKDAKRAFRLGEYGNTSTAPRK